MSKTVEKGFRTFDRLLASVRGESEAAKRHRAAIRACLERNFGITHFFRTGSFGSGTSIRGHSTVDCCAVVPRENLNRDSRVALREVRSIVDARFPGSGIVVSSPAVLVPFGRDAYESTEVVPADYIGDREDYRVYGIADGAGGWMKASPGAHSGWIAAVDSALGGRVRPLVRFLKAWKYCNSVAISSFYLELLTVSYASEEDFIFYSVDVERILRVLWDTQLADIDDPRSVSPPVKACASDGTRRHALGKLEIALRRAQKARQAENEEQIHDAYFWWDRLFSGRFPAY